MRKELACGVVATLSVLVMIAHASANRRANLSAARSNLGGAAAARGQAGGGNAAAARANVGAARGNTNINRGNLDTARGNVNANRGTRGNINSGNVGATRPNISRPNTSAPSLGGGTPANRPSLNRPSTGGSTARPGTGITRPDRGDISANRPTQPITRPDRPSQPITRPGVNENRPGRPDLGNIGGNRPGGGSSIPDFGSRPITRPDLGSGNRPDLGNIRNRPDRPNFGGNRPEFERPTTLPDRDRLDDFLNIQRPDRDRPIVRDRPSLTDRPGVENLPSWNDRPGNDRPSNDRPNFDRPSWNERPERPIIGGGDRNDRIHDLPSWVNIDRDRLANVRDRWGNAITGRPDDLQRWTQRRPDRVARWRSWGNSVRFRWHVSGNGVFGPVWWTIHRPLVGWWHHWQHWNHPWNFWWRRSAFPVVTRWFVWRGPVVVWSQPIFYDYGPGGNVTFIDNRVLISGAEVGTVEEFAQSAADLATVSPPDDVEEMDETEWLPLGTFAVSTSEVEGEPTRFIQLAVSQEGIISGTYFNAQTDVAQAVLGQVDQETQRVAVRLGEDDDLVIETGLYNLTLDEAPVLVHFGSDQYEFFLLVRMDEPEEE